MPQYISKVSFQTFAVIHILLSLRQIDVYQQSNCKTIQVKIIHIHLKESDNWDCRKLFQGFHLFGELGLEVNLKYLESGLIL